MAKQPKPTIESTASEVVEEFYPVEEGVEYTDVTGKDDLPEGVAEVADKKKEAQTFPEKMKAAKEAKAAKATEVKEDDVPEDLKGKTPAQLAKMYKEAQSVIGRQGTELGDLRRTADQYIKAHMKATAPKEEPKKDAPQPDDVDFFTNPKDAIARAVAEHPLVKELQGAKKDIEARQLRQHMEAVSAKFNAAHPDAPQILGDEEFQTWVVKSPVRKELLLRAHQRYDLDAANDLFSTWKELKTVRTRTPAGEPEPKPIPQPVADKTAARVPTGGNAAPRAPQANGQGKIYRRADLIKLMQTDRARYEAMNDEITQAYREGRVR